MNDETNPVVQGEEVSIFDSQGRVRSRTVRVGRRLAYREEYQSGKLIDKADAATMRMDGRRYIKTRDGFVTDEVFENGQIVQH